MAVTWTTENEPPRPHLAAPIAGQFLGILTDTDTTPPTAVSDLAVDPNTKGISYLWLNWTAPSDPIPAPAAGEVNWALAANGGHVKASSEQNAGDRRYPASGAIDGSRNPENWGNGHGWASAANAPVPQWVEVELPEPRPVSRFIVTTYQAPNESASRWGMMDYVIEVWDDTAGRWQPVVLENTGRIMMTRVHALPAPMRTKRFRVVVSRVAPADGVARLLQAEAWGPTPK